MKTTKAFRLQEVRQSHTARVYGRDNRSFGPVTVEGPAGPVPGHRFELRYPGGWEDSTFEFWTDEQLVPLRLKMFAGEGELEYRLVSYTVHDEELLAVDR